MDENSPTQSIKKKSVKGYASSIFKDSSVSAVSGILATDSIARKIFKVLIFLLFTIGFLYQCITFLKYLLEYPTVVNIEIIKPERFFRPAYTFCNNQKIMRSKYCEKYPDRCVPIDPEFCARYSIYCRKFNIRVKDEYLTEEIPHEDFLQFKHDLKDIAKSTGDYFERNYSEVKEVFRIRGTDSIDYSSCFTLNSHIDDPNEPDVIDRLSYFDSIFSAYEHFVFTPEEDIFEPEYLPGILFSIHSPYDAANPFMKGHFLKPGRQYKISVYLQEEKLLPPPYKTNCMDYQQIWEENGKSGPRSQDMCRQKCLSDFISLCYNCSMVFLSYPTDKELICPQIAGKGDVLLYDNCTEIIRNLPSCVNACKEECLKVKYFAEVRELHVSRKAPNSSHFKNSRWTYVDVDFEDKEILRFEYRPQYQNIEAFSYIGGFIGIWLGISLVQVTDFFESLFLIFRYFCKKSKQSSPKTDL